MASATSRSILSGWSDTVTFYNVLSEKAQHALWDVIDLGRDNSVWRVVESYSAGGRENRETTGVMR